MYNSDLPTRAELPSTSQLLRSTAIAVVTAGALLVTVILPAEYAIDPTGIGRVLGLTEMGEIKQQLAEEAAADEAASAALIPAVADTEPATVSTPPEESVAASPAPVTDPASQDWADETVITLAPGEAAEIKLIMSAGGVASYEWSTDQGFLNSDLHGDGTSGQATSYRKGRAEASDSGNLTAAFDGSHGWFWRNRSDVPVTLTLKTRGAYTEIKRVL